MRRCKVACDHQHHEEFNTPRVATNKHSQPVQIGSFQNVQNMFSRVRYQYAQNKIAPRVIKLLRLPLLRTKFRG